MVSTEFSPARTGALPGLAVAMLLASMGTSIANIALPAIAVAFDAPFHRVQVVVVAYLASLTLGTVIAGRLGDRFGRRRLLLAGLGLFALASTACGLADDVLALAVARTVQGAGAAVLMTLSLALVRETADPSRVGRAMGVLGTLSALGTALGPSLGGVLIAALGWRAVFFVLVPLSGLAVVLTARRLPPDQPVERKPGAGNGLLLRPALLCGFGANLLVAAVMMTTLVVGPFYLGHGLGLAPAAVGLVMSVGPAISILVGVPSGRLVDAWSPALVLRLGLAAMTAGCTALALAPGWLGVTGYLAGIALLTPGYQLFQAANNTQIMATADPSRRGLVSGVLTLSRNLGLILGASAMGMVFAYGTGTRVIEAATSGAVADGARLAFSVCAALMLTALAIARCDRKGPGPEPTP